MTGCLVNILKGLYLIPSTTHTKKNSFNGDVDYPFITLTTFKAEGIRARGQDCRFTHSGKEAGCSRLSQEADCVKATLHPRCLQLLPGFNTEIRLLLPDLNIAIPSHWFFYVNILVTD